MDRDFNSTDENLDINTETHLERQPRDFNEYPLVGFWVRSGAFIIDYLLCVNIHWVVMTSADRILWKLNIFDFNVLDDYTFNIVVLICMYSMMFLYFVFWQALANTTPGKYLFCIKIVTVWGQPFGFLRSVARTAGYIASVFFFGMGFIMVAFNHNKSGLHDWMASTSVVYTRTISLYRKALAFVALALGIGFEYYILVYL